MPPFQQYASWLEAGENVMRAVCCIEVLQDDGTFQSYGTGFLISPSRVVTCYHVLDQIARLQGEPLCKLTARPALPEELRRVRCRFGFTDIPYTRGIQAGRTYRFAAENWHVASEAHWKCTADNGAPGECPETPGQCQKQYLRDYVVLELEPADTQQQPNTRWLARNDIQPGMLKQIVNEPLFIVQHPEGKPMVVSMGRAYGLSPDAAENFLLLHDARTEDASSGSPCLSMDWKVVAIHQAELLSEAAHARYDNPIHGNPIRSATLMSAFDDYGRKPTFEPEPQTSSPAYLSLPAAPVASDDWGQPAYTKPFSAVDDLTQRFISLLQKAAMLLNNPPSPSEDFRTDYDNLIQTARHI